MGEHDSPLRLVVEVSNEDPVRGTITAPTGDQHTYVGWLALIGAVEAMRRPAENPAAEQEVSR
jgi:hypothetical protein